MQMCGRNGTEVLAQITNILTGAGLAVSSANINTGAEGPVCDIFRITNAEGKQVRMAGWVALCCAVLPVRGMHACNTWMHPCMRVRRAASAGCSQLSVCMLHAPSSPACVPALPCLPPILAWLLTG